MQTLPRNFPEIDTNWLGLDDEACLAHFIETYREADYGRFSPAPTAKELVHYGIWIGLLMAADVETPDPTPSVESFVGHDRRVPALV